MPASVGYSQLKNKIKLRMDSIRRLGTYSKSRPSKLYFVARSVTVLTNAVLFSADPTLAEKYREPLQPPTVTRALTPYMQAIS